MALIPLVYDNVSRRHELAGTVASGTVTDWIDLSTMSRINRAALCACIPGDGGSMNMEYTLDSKEAAEADTADPIYWDPGLVSIPVSRKLPTNVTAIRFTATDVNGKYKVII